MYVKSPLMKALAFSSATFLLSSQAYAGSVFSCCFKGNPPECECEPDKPAPKTEQENTNDTTCDKKPKPAPEPESGSSTDESNCGCNEQPDPKPTPQPEPKPAPQPDGSDSSTDDDLDDPLECKPKPEPKAPELPAYDLEVPSDYLCKTDCEKRAFVWKEIKASVYNPLPALPKPPSNYEKLLTLFKLKQQTTNNGSDFSQEAKIKSVNAYGVVAPMHLEPTLGDHPFTGLYNQKVLGLMRIASLMSPGPSQKGKYDPNVSLKFFVDSEPSKNLMTAPVDGSEKPWNTFSSVQSTRLDVSGSSFLSKQIFKTLNRMNMPALESLSETNSLGDSVSSPNAPKEIILQPTAFAQAKGFIEEDQDFRMNLHISFKKGDKLYDVYGVDDGGKKYLLGTLVIDAPFLASAVGDQYLRFQN